MQTAIDALAKTPLPTLLVIAGVLFLFLAMGGQLGARFSTRRLKPIYATGVGLALLVVGIWLQMVQTKSGVAGAQEASPKAGNVVTASVTPAPADQQARPDAYALRGSAVKGQTTQSVVRFEIRDAAITVEKDGKTTMGKTTQLRENTSVLEVIAVEEGRASVLRLKILKDATDSDVELAGQHQKVTKPGALEGRSILIELRKGRWVKTLEGVPPDAAQQTELKQPYVDADVVYPTGKVPPGYEWQLKDHQLAQFMPSALSITGSANSTFTGVEMYRGEKCAAIDTRMEMHCQIAEDNIPGDLQMSGNSRTYRSLEQLFDSNSETEGKMVVTQTPTDESGKMVIRMVGDYRTSSSTDDITNQRRIGLESGMRSKMAFFDMPSGRALALLTGWCSPRR